MVQVLTMPMMGNTMEVGTVVEWVVDEGDAVSEGETVVVIESEKASNEITAAQDGRLASIDVAENVEVPPGTQLGVILGPDEDTSDIDAAMDTDEAVSTVGDTATSEVAAVETTAPGDDAIQYPETPEDAGRTPAAPGARKRARESSVQLEAVKGTGPDGVVLIADIESHLEAGTGPDSEPTKAVVATPRVRRLARELGVTLSEVDSLATGNKVTESDVRRAAMGDPQSAVKTGASETADTGSVEFDPASQGLTVSDQRQLTGMRSTIARQMSQSVRQKPHVTLNRTVPAVRALEVVEEYSDAATALGLNDILVCATVAALERHPEFNAWFHDGTHSLVEEINIGVAVDIDDGLVTPVLRNAETKTPVQLANERAELTQRVQANDHSLEDIQCGTFTISNLGMFGVDSFDPIINPPQIAILGVGRIQDAGDDPALTLSLSFDHRIVDGAHAARFLETYVDAFTAPTVLLTRRFEAALE